MAAPNDASPPPPAAPPASSPSAPAAPAAGYENAFVHNVALVMTPVALGALFLPPRRMDVRMLVLGGSALWGVNQLSYDYRGESVLQKYGVTPNPRRTAAAAEAVAAAAAGGPKAKWGTLEPLPSERAAQVQARIRAEKARRERARDEAAGPGEAERAAARREEARRARARSDRGPLEQLWMGDADDDWREKRDRKEREALREGGGGYWGLISDQLGEVWSRGGQKKKEEEEEAACARRQEEPAGKKSPDGKNAP